MKKTLLSVLFALMSSSAHAGLNDLSDDDRTGIQVCIELEKLAGTVMEARQNNILLSTMLVESAKEDDGPDDLEGKLTEWVLVKAYDEPLERTPEAQEQAVVDFRNEMMLTCLEAQQQNRERMERLGYQQ